MNTERRLEDLETTTLQNMREQYIQDQMSLYEADISDEEYWKAYHFCNDKLRDIEKELKDRKVL